MTLLFQEFLEALLQAHLFPVAAVFTARRYIQPVRNLAPETGVIVCGAVGIGVFLVVLRKSLLLMQLDRLRGIAVGKCALDLMLGVLIERNLWCWRKDAAWHGLLTAQSHEDRPERSGAVPG